MYGIDLPLISSIGHKRWVNNEINLIFFLAYTIFATYLVLYIRTTLYVEKILWLAIKSYGLDSR